MGAEVRRMKKSAREAREGRGTEDGASAGSKRRAVGEEKRRVGKIGVAYALLGDKGGHARMKKEK